MSAPGHMAHPYELENIKTGSDLIEFFNKAKEIIEKKGSATLKVDGVNTSFKLVESSEGKYEFAVDRGSLKEIDISGVTKQRINERFPLGHGMREFVDNVLSILNEALPKILPELKKLGLVDDPTKFINAEYISNKTNVIEHKGNFLAFHGVNQFYRRSDSKNGSYRPGLERPHNVKDNSVEIPFQHDVMESLIKKIKPYAEVRNFNIFGQILTEKKNDFDFSNTLSSPLTFHISEQSKITKTLGSWLSETTIPKYKSVTLSDGRKVEALNKTLYNEILSGKPIISLIQENDAESAVYGAIVLEATRQLGQCILDNMNSPLGEVKNFEGIVLRNKKLSENPVKITGNFILEGMKSPFSKERKGIVDEDQIVNKKTSGKPKKVAIIPGSFKPPHIGHLQLVEQYSKMADEVVVIISSPIRNNREIPGVGVISSEQSRKIWEVIGGELPNVKYVVSQQASPISAAYDIIHTDSQFPPNTKFMIGFSRKGDDYNKFINGLRGFKNPNILPFAETIKNPIKHSSEYISKIKNSPLMEKLPSKNKNLDPRDYHAEDARYILSLIKEEPSAKDFLGDFFGESYVDDVLSILEISSMSQGNIQGSNSQVKKKKFSTPYRSFLGEEDIINEVYKLIRGIIL